MKRYIWGILLCLVCAGRFVSASEAERVSGSLLIETASDLELVLLDVVAQPLSQGEIDLFLADADAILGWAEGNANLWLSAEDAEDPVALIKTFPVWQGVDISYSEFMGVVSKLMFLDEIEVEEVDLDGMKQELQGMRGFVASGQVPPEALPQVKEMVENLEKMLFLVESVVPRNRPIFEQNRVKVSPYLKRLQAIEE